VDADRSGDLYNYPRRLEKNRQALAGMKNGQTTLAFLDHLLVLGLSVARVSKYAAHLRTLLRQMNFSPETATRKDVEEVVAWITVQKYKDWTKHDLKLILRKLVQYAKQGSCNRETPVPPEVSWIPLNVKNQVTVRPEDLLTPDELDSLFKHTRCLRDLAMLYTLFEGALRPGELLTMTVSSVEFKDHWCLISVNGKTGLKRLPLALANPILLRWLQEHPYRTEPEAPLWVSRATNGQCIPLHYASFREIVKNTTKAAGIKKRVWGYLFRHTYLTQMAKRLTEQELKRFAGWTPDSKMASRYVHFSAKDIEEKILSIHGLVKQDDGNPIFQLKTCPRCGAQNEPTATFCNLCGLVLDQQTALKTMREEEQKMQEILRRVENAEKLLSSLVAPKPPA